MKKEIQIKGMHCISCEIILEKELEKLDGVKLIMVSHKKGVMKVEYSKKSDYDNLKKAIEKSGFSVLEAGENNQNNNENNSLNNILSNIIAIFLVIILLMASHLFDIYTIIPDTSSVNYFSAILIGIIASFSTCLAITGGIIVGFSRYLDSGHGFLGHLKVQSAFQFGRLLGFFIFGGILGYFGSFLSINFTFTAILTLFVGFLLFYMGLNILGLVPSITKYGVHMPKSFTKKIEALGQPKYAPIVGALTFFLPCGFTQTMQLLAVGSGSFWQGGLVMMLFALGTTPAFLALGLGSSYFNGKKFPTLTKIIGALVIFFGLFTLFNSYNLVKYIDLNPFSSNTQDISEAGGEQVGQEELEDVNVEHNGYKTMPSFVQLEAGGNYRVTITPSSNGLGCMSTLVIPGISKKVHQVREGEPMVYEIYDAQAGRYNIVCASMGMTQGQIIIQ